MQVRLSWPHWCMTILCLLSLVADCIRLIRERGFRDGSYYYHLGDGSHAYWVNVETKSSIYFKCALYEKLHCRGRAIYRIGGNFRHSNAHNHPPDPDFVGERHFMKNVLERCEDAKFVKFEDILNEARQNRRFSRSVRAKMNMRRLRGAMYASRMKTYPAIPHTLRDLTKLMLHQQIRERVSATFDDDDNLYAGSCTAGDGSHHLFFFSKRMLHFMSNAKVIQSDGTFRARPSLPNNCQCFVLVTPWRDAVIPLGWVLMERRTLSAYKAVFQTLKKLCPNIVPELVITDWEYAQQKAWQETFPNAEIQGCLWHLSRAFIEKANMLHVLRFKRCVPSLMKHIKKACAISLLPLRYFHVGLRIVKDGARQDDIAIAYLLRHFFEYVETKWIGNATRRRWMNFFKSVHRTNNLCESHNKMLRTKVGAYRPNISQFIHALGHLEHNATLDIEHMTRGGTCRRARRWQSVYADRQIKALSRDLEMDLFHNMDEAVQNFLDRAINLIPNGFDADVRNYVLQ